LINNKVINSPARKLAIKKGFRSGLELKVSGMLKCLHLNNSFEPFKLPYRLRVHKATIKCVFCESNTFIEEKQYLPDFVLNDFKVVLEVKGIFTMKDRKKMFSVIKYNPDYEFVMVFQNPKKKISKHSKYTYQTWCNKNGIESTGVKELKHFLITKLHLKSKKKYINGKKKMTNGRKKD